MILVRAKGNTHWNQWKDTSLDDTIETLKKRVQESARKQEFYIIEVDIKTSVSISTQTVVK